jgi:hypothetical protein
LFDPPLADLHGVGQRGHDNNPWAAAREIRTTVQYAPGVCQCLGRTRGARGLLLNRPRPAFVLLDLPGVHSLGTATGFPIRSHG